MNRQHLLILALATTAAASLQAMPADTLATAEHAALWQQQPRDAGGNPALMTDRYATSLSEIRADYAIHQAGSPLLYQTGSGEAYGRIEANSYLRLSPRTTVWGEASYRTGKRHTIKWNSTADYLLLYPYVMADTLGGGLTSERYTFRGGWAGNVGRFDIGAEADFRAEHEYRTYDPRPRSIVTDLSAKVGAAYRLERYRLAASFGGRFYKQTNNVAFYREAGVIPEYQMTGLGTDYKRFSGSKASVYYKGTGFSASLALHPANEHGAFVSAAYDYMPYRRILPNLNALPLTTLYVETLSAEAGWKQTIGRARLALSLGADYERRTGDEHVAGNSASSEYRVITDLTMYHAHNVDCHATATLSIPTAHDVWALRLRGGMTDFKARYVYPERIMSWKKAYAALAAQWQHRFKQNRLLTCDVNTAAHFNTAKDLQMPFATLDDVVEDLIDHTYTNLTADLYTASVAARFDTPLPLKGRYGLFVRLEGRCAAVTGWCDRGLTAAVGMTF